MKIQWSEMWRSYCETHPNRYTLIQPNIPSKPWHENLDIPRKYITIINRIKFGHACYPSFLAKIGIIQSSLCEYCQMEGNLEHIFFSCQKNQYECNLLYNNILHNSVPAPFNLSYVLSLNRRELLSSIIQFIKNTNLKL